jgi:hypothetical protein
MIRQASVIIFVIVLVAVAGTAAAQPPPPPPPDSTQSWYGRPPGGPPPHRPFVDLNGDGLNDLAPDWNRDGLPDALDPMFRGPQARWRMKWLLLMPEAAKHDSTAFVEWWVQFNTWVPPERAWHRWQNAWFFSLPDSVKNNQQAFRNWWIESRRPEGWEMAWHIWRRWLDMGGPEWMDHRRRMDPNEPGMRPGQFRDDPRRHHGTM